tara:strand:- start:26 stop:718 length:693 start_codon:yes stop_codon:yes gene_type:complete
MNICIIPARGGSKRIKNKNIRSFNGKPIIRWSIETALKTNCFERVIVSTDNKEIADIALSNGAEVPFKRPLHLSDDYSTTRSTIIHAINYLEKTTGIPNAICCLYATAVFTSPEDLIEGLSKLKAIKEEKFVFAGSQYESPIQRALRINKYGSTEMINPENFNTRTQDLERNYHDIGQFYWGRTKAWLNSTNIFEGSYIQFLKSAFVNDIDTEEDWERAEYLHNFIKNNP